MKRIGRYEVVRELRAGGMGSVTLGQSPDGQLVVLKRPHSVDPEAAVRLRDEARIGARLLHPAIVDTLDLFEVESVPVLVVAYVDGPSLEVLRPLGPLPTGVIARVGRQIAEGLFALHETSDEHGRPLHILHRDVTPGNIVVGRDGDAKLIDLGIARFSEREAQHTKDGFLRGTMRYLAPELLQGGAYSAASDLWALGMVLWEAALGRFAYRGETDREVLAGILRGEPMELEEGEHVDEELMEVIRRLLHPSPALRLSSGAELATRFAALEERHGDTAALTQITIADALERKAVKDRERKARLAHMLKPENLGFPSPMREGKGAAGLFADVETAAEEVEEVEEGEEKADESPSPGPDPFATLPGTEPLAVEERPASDPFEREVTVSVPAPVSFLMGGTAPPAPEAPGDEAFSDEGASGEDALDATTPMRTLALPREALRSDDATPREHAPEADPGELTPPPVTFAEEAGALVDETGRVPSRSADEDDSPTLVGSMPREVLEWQREREANPAREPKPEPPPLPPPERSTPVARIALVRKSAAQIEAERAGKAHRPPSLDDLPPARPKPREEPLEEGREHEREPSREIAAEQESATVAEPPAPSPSAPFASLFAPLPDLVERPPERSSAQASPKERAAGEVMKLSDVVALLDDD